MPVRWFLSKDGSGSAPSFEVEGTMQQKPLRVLIPFFLVVVFIAFGDRFLPEPLKSASANTRQTLNQVMMGLVPNNWKPGVDPNESAEEAFEKLDEEKKK